MAEKDKLFSTEVKHTGIFDFKELYLFMHTWLTDELSMDLFEKKYVEKITGNTKEVEFQWESEVKLTDYFKFEMTVKAKVQDLEKVQVQKGNAKINTNKGRLEIKIGGILVRDYNGKFESTAFQKFLRGIYEKWVIPSRVKQYQGKILEESNEFVGQIKAFLDLESK